MHTKHSKLKCPSCEWVPNGESLWSCTCQHNWDTFQTKGKCPSCEIQWADTYCPVCGQTHKHEDWYHRTETSFNRLEQKLGGLKVPELINVLWSDKYDSENIRPKFNFRSFGAFELLTPKSILVISYKWNSDSNKIHFSNSMNSLKEKGRLPADIASRFRKGAGTDIILVHNDYKNRLHKYKYPMHYINRVVPVAFLREKALYLCLGYDTAGICNGFFLVNDLLEFPLFVSADINQVVSEFQFESTHEPRPNEDLGIKGRVIQGFVPGPDLIAMSYRSISLEVMVSLFNTQLAKENSIEIKVLQKDLENKIALSIKNENGTESQIDLEKNGPYDERNFFNQLVSCVNDWIIMEYYIERMKNVFKIDFKLIPLGVNRMFSLQFIRNKKEEEIKVSLPSNSFGSSFVDTLHSMLNNYLKRIFGLDLNYAFYRVGNHVYCLTIEEAVDLAREGVLDLNIDQYFPVQAWCAVVYPALQEKHLKYTEEVEMVENTKRTFLKDLSRY
ncbi:MAG: hypothetical protein P1U56_11160 [Saprospiraceae bacterium]|nr:hypothetical protein [Saprospiraceae bacterium]